MLATALGTGQPTPMLLLRALAITYVSMCNIAFQGRSQSSTGTQVVQICSTVQHCHLARGKAEKRYGILEQTFIY